VVNASLQPSAFYLDTVRGLCSNTTFEFAVWMANLLLPGTCGGGIQPNLTFTIEKLDGTVLQSYSTGDIPSVPTPTWQQVGFYFVTPSGAGASDVVLRIVNNATGGCGNDLALDDITFRPCGPTIMANISGSPNDSISFCAGNAQAVTFNGNVLAGLTNPALQWQQNINNSGWQDVPGATGTILLQDFTTQPPGTYQFRVGAVETGNLVQCRTLSRVLTVIIKPGAALVDAGPDKSILQGETTQLDGSVKGSVITYNWSPTVNMTNINSLTPRVSPPADIDYVLSITATADSVCGKSSDTAHVFVYPDIYIPNAFTPNRDGINDTWRIPALNALTVFELSIFNRYGQLIYHNKNSYMPWNGQFKGIDQPNGGYVYLLNINNGKRVFKGIVLLVK
jgi:gliding motility-associated-like protein